MGEMVLQNKSVSKPFVDIASDNYLIIIFCASFLEAKIAYQLKLLRNYFNLLLLSLGVLNLLTNCTE